MDITIDNGGIIDTMLGLAGLLVFLTAMGWVAGRVLGVKRGFWRAAIAGLVGFVSGQVITDIQFGSAQFNDLGDLAKLGFGFLGYVLLMTMLASIVLEVLLRPRKRRTGPRQVPHPIKAIKGRLQTVSRLREIFRAARKSGLTGRVARRESLASAQGAEALRKTLETSGGILVKFGQIASTREDILPATITEQLGQLRTSVEPLPFPVVKEVVEAELGPLDEVFASFDPKPLAAASIGVTHAAVLPDGREVIVKVQRPGIEEVVARDGRVLRFASRQLERRSGTAARLGFAALADQLIDGVQEELDFRREQHNNAAMREARSSDPGIRFPTIYPDLTKRTVLVMDRVAGVPVSDAAAVDASGIPRAELAANVLRSFLSQVLTDGVYHADPHPGNILIDQAGELWFIDYGAVGHIDPVTFEALQQLAGGFIVRDPSVLARAVRRLAGSRGDDLDMIALEFDLSLVLTEVGTAGFDPKAIEQVIRVLGRHGIPAPSSLTLLGRSALTLEGTLKGIDPGFRMADEASRLLKGLNAMDADPRAFLTKEAVRAVPALRGLPQLAEDIALQARSGRLTLRVERYAGEEGRRAGHLLDEILFTALAIGGLLGSAILLVAAGLTDNEAVSLYLRVIGFTGIVVSTAMQMRTVARILNRRTRDEAD